MQLSTKESDAEQFQDYLNKTFCKTASLFANTCKAVNIDLQENNVRFFWV
jgi:geranylgeranyl pyrophosphate synthase